MVYPDTFQGFQIEDPKYFTDFKLNELQPKPFGDYDVDIKIMACGVCASDVHTLSGGWGEQHFPLCCGHGWFYLISLSFAPSLMFRSGLMICRNCWHCAEGWTKGYAD
jgi:hypothetical protein